MAWTVLFHEEFDADYAEFGEAVQDELLALLKLLREHGPKLGRPHVDTLKGSDHANMKELRFNVDGGVWRVAFAFDTEREAILLVGGDKSGTGQDKFYKRLIAKADKRFGQHLKELKAKKAAKKGK